MKRKQCIAMLLAGGRGTRLEELTEHIAKPAVPFGGKYRIIDFTLSNIRNSAIDTVGVLTQYQPHLLQNHIGRGDAWELQKKEGGLNILPPYQSKDTERWYQGTAHAIFQNMDFIQQYNPSHVLIISGDHIYKMDYNEMLSEHIKNQADVTISVMEVPWNEASRFGILDIHKETNQIISFQEKPAFPTSNLASMGIYIFKWEVLKRYLEQEENNPYSSKDFGKDIIPSILYDKRRLYAFKFKGYWKDVGTIESYWEANMDLLNRDTNIFLTNKDWEIYTVEQSFPPTFTDTDALIKQSLISGGNEIIGEVHHSVLFNGVKIGKGSVIKNSVILPNTVIGENAFIENVIVAENINIPNNYIMNSSPLKRVSLLGKNINQNIVYN